MIKAMILSLILLVTTANAGLASYYGGKFHGRTTASGEIFNKWAMTTASNSHKMGTKLLVTNKDNGKSVVVKVNDTGGFKKYGRTLDLSRGAFSKIANINKGVINVSIKKVN
jgi:rare lipoprotein A